MLPVTDTLKKLRKEAGRLCSTGEVVDRSFFYGAQTPQIFWSEQLKAAYGQGFNTCFTDYISHPDHHLTILCNNDLQFETQHLLLCLGHSARDTIRHLYQKGLEMEPKSFSIGVRVEHLQKKVNAMQYGRFASCLPPASYKGAVHL